MENGVIIESAQWNNNCHLFGFLTLFPYLVSASLRWTSASWACPWPSNRCLRCWPGARDWSVSRRRAVRTWRSRPVKTECSSPPVGGTKSRLWDWLKAGIQRVWPRRFTYRHCYLSFAGRGREEMLLTAGVPEDTERGQSMCLRLKSAGKTFCPAWVHGTSLRSKRAAIS